MRRLLTRWRPPSIATGAPSGLGRRCRARVGVRCASDASQATNAPNRRSLTLFRVDRPPRFVLMTAVAGIQAAFTCAYADMLWVAAEKEREREDALQRAEGFEPIYDMSWIPLSMYDCFTIAVFGLCSCAFFAGLRLYSSRYLTELSMRSGRKVQMSSRNIFGLPVTQTFPLTDVRLVQTDAKWIRLRVHGLRVPYLLDMSKGKLVDETTFVRLFGRPATIK